MLVVVADAEVELDISHCDGRLGSDFNAAGEFRFLAPLLPAAAAAAAAALPSVKQPARPLQIPAERAGDWVNARAQRASDPHT